MFSLERCVMFSILMGVFSIVAGTGDGVDSYGRYGPTIAFFALEPVSHTVGWLQHHSGVIWFLVLSRIEIPRIRRRQRIWNTSSFFRSLCSRVHDSALYSSTDRMRDLKVRIFVDMLMLLLRQKHQVNVHKAAPA